jgi:hypothetical protein
MWYLDTCGILTLQAGMCAEDGKWLDENGEFNLVRFQSMMRYLSHTQNISYQSIWYSLSYVV